MPFDKTEATGANWTRRQFVCLSAGVAASASMPRLFASQVGDGVAGFAYATSHENGERGRIHVYAVRGDRWKLIETLPSDAPSFTCLSADGRTFYVANEVAEVDGLPRGSVTVYRVGSDGRLDLMSVKALSLAAARPKHLAMSPDGKTLAVAASGGGIYNIISVREDGWLGAIRAIRKETGFGPHETQTSARPHTLRFDNRNGLLLASDYGSDRVSLFELEEDKLVRRQALLIDPGSGPGSIAIGVAALYVRNMLSGCIDVYRYEGKRGAGEKIQSVALDTGADQPLAFHASGRTLYAGGKNLVSWGVRDDGKLVRLKTMKGVSADRLVPAFDGRVLFAVDSCSGIIRQLTLDAQAGEPTKLQDVVEADARWTSLSMLTV